jgi:hypothetical protein
LGQNGREKTERNRERKGEANTTEERNVRGIKSNGKEIRKEGTKERRE